MDNQIPASNSDTDTRYSDHSENNSKKEADGIPYSRSVLRLINDIGGIDYAAELSDEEFQRIYRRQRKHPCPPEVRWARMKLRLNAAIRAKNETSYSNERIAELVGLSLSVVESLERPEIQDIIREVIPEF